MNTKKTRVLICGGTGFIGRNLVERLSARPDLDVSATCFSRQPPASPTADGVAWVHADLTDRRAVDEVIAGQDVVIQAAAVTTGINDTVTQPHIHVTDNAVMNSLIVRACHQQRVRQMVFFSCSIVYASQEAPATESAFAHDIDGKYFGPGWTKVYIEKICEFFSRLGHTRFTVIRHSNVYGPHDKYDLQRSHVLGATIHKAMTASGGTIVVWGDGTEKRDLLYVSDLVDFVETVIGRQRVPFEVINVGAGLAIPVRELVEAIVRLTGRTLAIEFDRTKPSVQFSIALDSTRARVEYGWTPRVSLEAGLRRSLDWFAANVQEGENRV